jgi:oligosaccharyl transferase (archaeosortase A-associated)
MTQGKYSPSLLVGIMLCVFFGIALYLRVSLPYDQVFVDGWIKFNGVDAYYHMRLVENLLHHFPQHITFDPYTFYPHGTNVFWPFFFDWLIAGIAWLVGLGSPTQHSIDMVGVYLPAILGAITVIPVYYIGKELFNRWVGVISAGLIAIIPGEFLGRSTLGFTDHHVAEFLFTAITMLFLILAINTARRSHLTFNRLRRRDWSNIIKPLIYSLLAGISLGIYLLSWVGGLLFVFLIFAYFVIQFVIDHLRGKTTDYLGIVGTLSFFIAAVISQPLLPRSSLSPLYVLSFIIAILMPVILFSLSRLMARVKLKPAYYPLTLLGLGLAVLGILYIIDPSLLKSAVERFGIFTPSGASLTILEVHPLLFPTGSFSLSAAWGNFTTGFFLSFISLGILIYSVIKRGEADKALFVVWSLVILAATLGQRRFAYYFAVNVALANS